MSAAILSPFSAAFTAPQRPSPKNFRLRLLFPSESYRKSCGKRTREICTKIMCKTCGKSVDFLRITRQRTVENPADNLRRTGGIPAEKHPKARLHPVD